MDGSLQARSVMVPLDQMAEFNKRLVALNEKAAKFGLSPIEVGKLSTRRYYYDVTYEGRDNDILSRTLKRLGEGEAPPRGEAIVLANVIELSYPEIKLGDWAVVAKLENFNDSKMVFSISRDPTDEERFEAYRDCPIACEHCNVNRARKQSYLLKNTAGEIKEVGSTCLEDFTGIDPAAALFLMKLHDFVRMTDASDELDSGFSSGSANAFDTIEYLVAVQFVAEQFGYISASRAKETGYEASYAVAMRIGSVLRAEPALGEAYWESAQRMKSTSQSIIDWYADKEAGNSFERNLQLILASDYIPMDRKYLAYAASAVPAYQKYLAASSEVSEKLKPSEHVGSVGDKIIGELRITAVYPLESRFGLAYRVNMKDAENNNISWLTGRPPAELLETSAIGKPFTAQFKIKKHSDYRETLITEVTHLKVKEWISTLSTDVPSAAKSIVLDIHDTQGASFIDLGVREEISSIISSLSTSLVGWDGDRRELVDTNGNEIGHIYTGEVDQPSIEPTGIRILIHKRTDLPKALEEAAEVIKQEITEGEVHGADISFTISVGAEFAVSRAVTPEESTRSMSIEEVAQQAPG